MTLNVYQHWDPLQICIVGRSYPPEFYSWIKIPHVRKLFERIAIETEEDYQGIISKLQEFGVEVLRPNLPKETFVNNQFVLPPMTPRDYTCIIGTNFYENYSFNFNKFYSNVKDNSWPDCASYEDFLLLPRAIQDECIDTHQLRKFLYSKNSYDEIFNYIRSRGNTIISHFDDRGPAEEIVNGSMVTRIGKDLFFGTTSYDQDQHALQKTINKEFTQTRNHVVNTGGHSDGTYCPVCPGLIISLYDVPTYEKTFPDWEVVYLPGQNWHTIQPFLQLKEKNAGKWWIPGFEHDQNVINFVETWLGHWTGYVEETVFDVNMLIIDPKNVMVFNYNKKVFDALERYGITPHVVTFRHRFFWDGGIHCITSDLHRKGPMQDFFPNRK